MARGPMQALTDPSIEKVTIMAPTQLLKTEYVLNICGYFIHQDPSPILVVQPTVDMAETWSKDRLDPMLRDSPELNGIINEKKKESGNKILHKQFFGGHITMVGANAPGNLAMRPVRIVLFDEIDKYPASAGKEGDPVKLATERTATFWNRKIVHVCSPTIEGMSRISQSYDESDQRIFLNPCPHCEKAQEMQWEQVKWPDGEPIHAYYHCYECGKAWTERQRLRSIQLGTWEATKPFNGHAGFKCSKLTSPWEPISKIAKKYEESKDKPEQLKVFINTQLARTYKEQADVPDWHRLYERREDYKLNVIPKEAIFITAGVDVQQDRLELEIVAWGANKQSWSIDYRVLQGRPQDEAVWELFDQFVGEVFEVEGQRSGRHIDKICVDSGYATTDVYAFTAKHPRSKVICTKGSDSFDQIIGMPKPVDYTKDGRRFSRATQMRTIGSSFLKGELYGWLKKDAPLDGEPDPYGFCHFPMYSEEYFKMLTAEELQTKIVNGYPKRQWVKVRERNEALDCRALARVSASICGLDRIKKERLEQVRPKVAATEGTETSSKIDAPAVKKNKTKRRESSYL